VRLRQIRGVNKDRLTKERRSWNMSRIRGKDTMPEKRVRSLLHRLGYRFRLHVRIPVSLSASTASPLSTFNHQPATLVARVRCRKVFFVRPDIVLAKHKTAIFVHGCFWHRHLGCKNCATPTHRRAWWLKKLEGNAARDKLHQRALRRLGWQSVVIWECETENLKLLQKLGRRLRKLLG
jgi:DNA mismatch endonuclease (patch repair protein)